MIRHVALVTGGFDPIHIGHTRLINASKDFVTNLPPYLDYNFSHLVIGLNSDEWLKRKKGYVFMPFDQRREVLLSMRAADRVFGFDDSDDTAKEAIMVVRNFYPDSTLWFCNGGDRGKGNVPEEDVNVSNIQFKYGMGGDDKPQASSNLVEAACDALNRYRLAESLQNSQSGQSYRAFMSRNTTPGSPDAWA